MPPQDLQRGDKVVGLGAIARSAACLTGGAAAAWLTWRITRSRSLPPAAIVPGVALGYFPAHAIARILYRDGDGRTTVVKTGPRALAAALPAGLARRPLDGLLITLLALMLSGSRNCGFSSRGLPWVRHRLRSSRCMPGLLARVAQYLERLDKGEDVNALLHRAAGHGGRR
jgi:hypothetical protein